MDNDINNNRLENEIFSNLTKECPYCNIILSSKEYNDHIYVMKLIKMKMVIFQITLMVLG